MQLEAAARKPRAMSVKCHERIRQATTQMTIFYVDDNPKALRMLAFVLAECGYEVVTACSSCEVLERMEQTSFDLVLMVHRGRQVMDPKLVQEVKHLNPDIPILMVSANTLLAHEEVTCVDAYAGKGTTLDNLLAKIRALTGQRA